MLQTPETVGENFKVWVDKVDETAHYMLDREISSSDKAKELVRYAIISESSLFGHIGLGCIWFGYNASYALKNLYQFTKGWVIDEKQNLDEIAKYCAHDKYSSSSRKG